MSKGMGPEELANLIADVQRGRANPGALAALGEYDLQALLDAVRGWWCPVDEAPPEFEGNIEMPTLELVRGLDALLAGNAELVQVPAYAWRRLSRVLRAACEPATVTSRLPGSPSIFDVVANVNSMIQADTEYVQLCANDWRSLSDWILHPPVSAQVSSAPDPTDPVTIELLAEMRNTLDEILAEIKNRR